MRVVIQRVSESSVLINGSLTRSIGAGLMILVGFEDTDNDDDISWMCKKIVQLRIFGDEEGKMNHSVQDIKGEILLISQFTLHASTVKGNRPSFIRAAKPDVAIPLYQKMIAELTSLLNAVILTGEFGADMKVSLINDGPVTISIDSKNRE
jgi:D-aminoacyl-tRNA deacylase